MRHHLFAVLVTATLAVGCSDSPATKTTSATKPPVAPQQVIAVDQGVVDSADAFMRAILAGDSQRAAGLLTTKAAQRYAADPSVLTPLGMQVEGLAIGEVRMIDTDQAAAQCLVTVPGVQDPQELCCLLKRGAEGWRVCGMACDTGDADTTVISFEDAPEPAGGQFVEQQATGSEVPRTAASPAGGELR